VRIVLAVSLPAMQDDSKVNPVDGQSEEAKAIALALRRNEAYNLEVRLAFKKLATVTVVVVALVLCLIYCNKCLWGVVLYSACHTNDSPIVAGVFLVSFPMAVISVLPSIVDGGIYAAETIHNIRRIQ
jgi:hypothetical protein